MASVVTITSNSIGARCAGECLRSHVVQVSTSGRTILRCIDSTSRAACSHGRSGRVPFAELGQRVISKDAIQLVASSWRTTGSSSVTEDGLEIFLCLVKQMALERG